VAKRRKSSSPRPAWLVTFDHRRLLATQTAQWQQLAAAAKKEGKVVVSTGGAELEELEGFEKRYGIGWSSLRAVARHRQKIADSLEPGCDSRMSIREGGIILAWPHAPSRSKRNSFFLKSGRRKLVGRPYVRR
jgi:hypothetical protein